MATAGYGFVQFSDGSFASLTNADITEATAESLTTGGTGLAQVSGIEIGQAYEGKTAIAAAVQIVTDDATTAMFSNAYFQGPDGKIICLVQGNGLRGSGLYKLVKPVRMQTGVKLYTTWDAQADAVGLASLAVYCSDGTADVFTATAVDATKTSMTNKDSATLGEALAGKVIVNAYGCYPSSKGLNDNQAGVSAFYQEAADGQLKYMYPPQDGHRHSLWLMNGSRPVRVDQNDTLSVMAGT